MDETIESEIFGRYSDHHEWRATEANGPSDDLRVGFELRFPEFVRQHDDGFTRIGFFKDSSDFRPDSEDLEVAGTHGQAETNLRHGRLGCGVIAKRTHRVVKTRRMRILIDRNSDQDLRLRDH